MTISGVPVLIILKVLGDGTARITFLKSNKREFHDRLQELGIEEKIKAFYRPKIHDEVKLDQYIHQLFYDGTGYVGDAYYVNSQGILALKQPVSDEFNQWFKLAYEVGLVTGSRQEKGIQYVIGSRGEIAPYKDIAAIFPLETLRSIAELKRQDKLMPGFQSGSLK